LERFGISAVPNAELTSLIVLTMETDVVSAVVLTLKMRLQHHLSWKHYEGTLTSESIRSLILSRGENVNQVA